MKRFWAGAIISALNRQKLVKGVEPINPAVTGDM